MSHRSTTTVSTSVLRLSAAALSIVAAPGASAAQRVGSSIDVTLTVLQPVATQSVQVIGLRVARDGLATLETTAPTAGPTSHIVMSRVSGRTRGFEPAPKAPPRSRSARPGYVVDVGPLVGASATPHHVELRVEYLVVPGT